MQTFGELEIGGGVNLPAGWEQEAELAQVEFKGLATMENKVEVHGFGTIESDKFDGDFAILALVVDGEKVTTGTGSTVIVDQLRKAKAADGFPFVATVTSKPGKFGNNFYTFA